jgi:hypothetical protein
VLPGVPGAAATTAAGSIHPGVSVTFGGVTCEAGAILHRGHTEFLAIPASCGGIDPGKVQDGCAEAETPAGIPVQIGGARHRGIVVYNSFTEMQLEGVTSSTKCYHNDLALVRIDPRDASRVSSRIPGMSAPRHIAAGSPKSGSHMTVGRAAATAGASHDHGWEQDFTSLANLGTTDVGASVMSANHLVGMLIVVPSGLLLKAPAEVYSFAKALHLLHRVRGFHHVQLGTA